MIKNIIKQLWNQRRTNGWIAAELVLVSVFLWILVYRLTVGYENFSRPMGFDIEDTYRIVLDCAGEGSVEYVDTLTSGTSHIDDLLTVLDRMRRVSGVESVASMSCAMPYSPCNSGRMIMSRKGNDTIYSNGMYRMVTPDYFRVFHIYNPQGKIAGQDIPPVMIVASEDLADSLKIQRKDSIWVGEIPDRFYVTDVCTKVRYAETWQDMRNAYLVLSEQDMIRNWGIYPDQICLRLRSGMNEAQRQKVWEDMKTACRVNNYSYFYSVPFKDIQKSYLTGYFETVKAQGWYVFFLLINIFLGVIGTFWFNTQHRRGEIGLRIATGATRKSIFLRLINEGLILQGVAMIMVILITVNLYVFDAVFEYKELFYFLLSGVITWLLIAIVIVLGISFPAYQSMKVKAAEALREE